METVTTGKQGRVHVDLDAGDYLMLPYHPEQGRQLPDRKGYDGFVYPEELEGIPFKLAIPRLNRFMVNESDCAIAYVRYT